MNLDELPALVAKLQDRSKQDAALQSLLSELSQTLADLLTQQEEAGPTHAKMIGEALRGIKFDIAAPSVSLKPQVDVHLKVEPMLQMQPQERRGWKFHVETGPYGAMDITCEPI